MGVQNKEQASFKDEEQNEVFFSFLTKKNVIVKQFEIINQEKDTKLTEFLFQTIYGMDLTISL